MSIYGYTRSQISEYYKYLQGLDQISMKKVIETKIVSGPQKRIVDRDVFCDWIIRIMQSTKVPLSFKKCLARELYLTLRYDEVLVETLESLRYYHTIDSDIRTYTSYRDYVGFNLPPTRYGVIIILAVFHIWCMYNIDTDLKLATFLNVIGRPGVHEYTLKHSIRDDNIYKPHEIIYGNLKPEQYVYYA